MPMMMSSALMRSVARHQRRRQHADGGVLHHLRTAMIASADVGSSSGGVAERCHHHRRRHHHNCSNHSTMMVDRRSLSRATQQQMMSPFASSELINSILIRQQQQQRPQRPERRGAAAAATVFNQHHPLYHHNVTTTTTTTTTTSLLNSHSRILQAPRRHYHDHQYHHQRTSWHDNILSKAYLSTTPTSRDADTKDKNKTTPQQQATSSTTVTSYHQGAPSSRAQLSKTAVPTPVGSSPPSEESRLAATLAKATPRSVFRKALDLTISVSQAIVMFLVRLPGNVLYFLTHPAKLQQRFHEIKDMAKEEANHYWVGTKLLYADAITARNLLSKTLQGSALTRRERKQLLRTVSDLFRLVPFSMFILIPFMEFALPIALRIFPNLLPSTFQDSLKEEEKMKRELKSRIVMAQFFQDTLEELAKEQKRKATKRKEEIEEAGGIDVVGQDTVDAVDSKEGSAKAMLDFLEKARSGDMIPPDVIIRYAKYFQDDLTLDNMPRMQLINMCKYMSIPPYGNDSLLRFQLRHHVRVLKEDDQRILWEGIDSLTKMELREACRERGMRSTGLSKDSYKRSLQQWLDLSVNKNVPISLLIMSRTFFLRDDVFIAAQPQQHQPSTATAAAPSAATDDSATLTTPGTAAAPVLSADEAEAQSLAGLADAISGLDKEVLNEVILEVATSQEKKSDPGITKIKLDVLKQQNELIKQEQEEIDAARRKHEAEVEATASMAPESPTSATASIAAAETTGTTAVDTEQPLAEIPPKATETARADDAEEEDRDLSTEEMDAISQLVFDDPVSKERAELERIKAAMKTDGAANDQIVIVLDKEKKDTDDESAAVDGQTVIEPGTLTGDAADAREGVASKAENAADGTAPEIMTSEEADRIVEEAIQKEQDFMDASSSSGMPSLTAKDTSRDPALDGEPDADVDEVDPVVARLKKRIESMVDKIEVQLEDAEVKIGDKLHYLDKDGDGILSREEVALALQQVLKREITPEEAMEITKKMDSNQDGFFTVDEFSKWIDMHKLVKFVEEGRDHDMDQIVEMTSPSSQQHREGEGAQQQQKQQPSSSSSDDEKMDRT